MVFYLKWRDSSKMASTVFVIASRRFSPQGIKQFSITCRCFWSGMILALNNLRSFSYFSATHTLLLLGNEDATASQAGPALCRCSTLQSCLCHHSPLPATSSIRIRKLSAEPLSNSSSSLIFFNFGLIKLRRLSYV